MCATTNDEIQLATTTGTEIKRQQATSETALFDAEENEFDFRYEKDNSLNSSVSCARAFTTSRTLCGFILFSLFLSVYLSVAMCVFQ